MIKLIDYNPRNTERQLHTIALMTSTENLWKPQAAEFLRLSHQVQSIDTIFSLLFTAQRLRHIHAAGLLNDKDFFDALTALSPRNWDDFVSPPAPYDLQHKLALQLCDGFIRPEKSLLIKLYSQSRTLGPIIGDLALQGGQPFHFNFDDQDFFNLVLTHANEAGIESLAQEFLSYTNGENDNLIYVEAGSEDKTSIPLPREKLALYSKAISSFRDFDHDYRGTSIPTQENARIDDIPYADYIQLFFELCNQPWDKIGEAQSYLIQEFDKASSLRITNSDGTHISMDISGFTFCNSLVFRNIPGSEIFSAPHKSSANGIIAAKGLHNFDGHYVRDLTMVFNNGELVSYDANEGLDNFSALVKADAGMRYIGEIGFGTNPRLTRHVSNNLLVEKIAGSFHIALGDSYTYTEYAGNPVHVDNGNRSDSHFDITTMLRGKKGTIYLDEKPIMKDGFWIGKGYDILNYG